MATWPVSSVCCGMNARRLNGGVLVFLCVMYNSLFWETVEGIAVSRKVHLENGVFYLTDNRSTAIKLEQRERYERQGEYVSTTSCKLAFKDSCRVICSQCSISAGGCNAGGGLGAVGDNDRFCLRGALGGC